ncbi:Uncharacterised protein [uncultured archaeon]|nr:Uncharacterised protein [uncultured archaeon]
MNHKEAIFAVKLEIAKQGGVKKFSKMPLFDRLEKCAQLIDKHGDEVMKYKMGNAYAKLVERDNGVVESIKKSVESPLFSYGVGIDEVVNLVNKISNEGRRSSIALDLRFVCNDAENLITTRWNKRHETNKKLALMGHNPLVNRYECRLNISLFSNYKYSLSKLDNAHEQFEQITATSIRRYQGNPWNGPVPVLNTSYDSTYV